MKMRSNGRRAGRLYQAGVTLIELLIVVIIIAVLAAIAVPIYQGYVGRTRRVAAEGCMMQVSNFMERYYTTNMSYVDPTTSAAPTLTLDCLLPAQTGADYTYSFTTATTAAYTFQAVPSTAQTTRDSAKCGTLTLTQAGAKTPTTAGCW